MRLTKALWILDIGDYLPEVTRITCAAFERYALRIGAELNVIRERRFPDWHVTYEKAQVHRLGADYDWNLVMDTDLLLHPDFPDLTERVSPFAVGVMDAYPASARFAANADFLRDGRDVGISGVFAMASRDCADFWTPLAGSQNDHLAAIRPLADEVARGVSAAHFITEYWLSRNLARYGLKYSGILREDERAMFHHPYGRVIDGVFLSPTDDEKLRAIREQARSWGQLQ